MTEDEAKTKWCPFARLGNEPGCNRWPSPDERAETEDSRARCIASACMAWRWDEPWTSQTQEGHGGDIVIRLKRRDGDPMLGYCGLAGAPR